MKHLKTIAIELGSNSRQTLIRESFRFLACAILFAIPIARAVSTENQTCESPPPSDEASYWLPVPKHPLPAEILERVKDQEKSVKDVLDGVPEPAEIAHAVAKAAFVLEQRTKYQGGDWWETVDARWRLTALRRLGHLSSPQLKRLKTSYSNAEKDEPSDADTIAKCTTLRDLMGNDYPEYAKCLIDSLDSLVLNDSQSQSILQTAVSIYRTSLGTQHPQYLESLIAAAWGRPDYYSAPEIGCVYAQRLELAKASDKPSHYIMILQSTARYYLHKEEYQVAAAALLEAILLEEQIAAPRVTIAKGGEVDTLGYLYDNLAKIYEAQQVFPKAEINYRKALDIYKNAHQDNQLIYACTESDYGDTLAKDNKEAEAAEVYFDLIHATFRRWATQFPTLNARAKDALVSTENHCNYEKATSTDKIYTLVFGNHGVRKELGVAAAIYTKQLALYAARQENIALISQFASNPAKWRSDWDEMRRLRRSYQAMTLPNFDSAESVHAFHDNIKQIQKANSIARRIRELDDLLRKDNAQYIQAAQLKETTVNDVRKALRPQQGLIEYVTFYPYDFKHGRRHTSAMHFGGLVVTAGTDEIAALDLGESSEINALVDALRGPGSSLQKFIDSEPSAAQEIAASEREVAGAAKKVQARVWLPFEESLHSCKRVFIAAEGSINLVPFEIFSSSDNLGHFRYVVEDTDIIYVGNARELGRLAQDSPEISGERRAVLIGNPDFNATTHKVAQAVAALNNPARANTAGTCRAAADSTGQLGDEHADDYLPPAWSDAVGRSLEQLLCRADRQLRSSGWSTQIIEGDDAVEEAVENVNSPTILQIATHGFFQKPLPELPPFLQSPLMRSMLIFAGVNSWKDSDSVFYRVGSQVLSESAAVAKGLSLQQLAPARLQIGDGHLTAYQVSALNLRKTLLVHLTACETGVGDVTADGVAGLRQAFLMAGARAVTMSMWSVPADESVEEMTNFYRYWLGDSRTHAETVPANRYQAFRQAELQALHSARENHAGSGHPFYWAGFVYYGDPGDL